MKIGIVTLYDYTNYGNRLQNYALTKLLENEEIGVINGLQVYTKEEWIENTNGVIARFFKALIPFPVFRKRMLMLKKEHEGLLKKREEIFIDFTNSYTVSMEPVITKTKKKAYEQLTESGISCFVAGSDQVWNPYYVGNSYELLGFAPPSKRFSFAASIGTDCIPHECCEYYKQCFQDMAYISVREQAAAELIKEMTGRVADITLDPTLLLPLAAWKKIIKKPKTPLKERYACTYFLGEEPEAVKDYLREKGLDVYRLNCVDDENIFLLDPSEFLYIIMNAEVVLTDSFHAVAFSIKFNKEFYVFNRKQKNGKDMFSRIETVTQFCGLQNRIQDRGCINEKDKICNWMEINEKLEYERRRSIDNLIGAIETNGQN